MKRKISVMLSLMLIMGMSLGTVHIASAKQETQIKYSSAATAGKWNTESTQFICYGWQLDHICGSDVGVWFYPARFGLSEQMHKSGRVVYINQYQDRTLFDRKVSSYTGNFGTYNGMYVPVSFARTYTNTSEIARTPDRCVDLYIEFQVPKHSQDSSTAITWGLLQYSFWAE